MAKRGDFARELDVKREVGTSSTSKEVFAIRETGSQFGSSVKNVEVAAQGGQRSVSFELNRAEERKDASDSRLRTSEAVVDNVFAEL